MIGTHLFHISNKIIMHIDNFLYAYMHTRVFMVHVCTFGIIKKKYMWPHILKYSICFG